MGLNNLLCQISRELYNDRIGFMNTVQPRLTLELLIKSAIKMSHDEQRRPVVLDELLLLYNHGDRFNSSDRIDFEETFKQYVMEIHDVLDKKMEWSGFTGPILCLERWMGNEPIFKVLQCRFL